MLFERLVIWYFYPRSPCGERHPETVPCGPDADISIHALLAESDSLIASICVFLLKFLSTLSLRRATTVLHRHGRGHRDFYPRSPCGERPGASGSFPISLQFLSTLSLRRATPHHPPGVAFPTLFLSTLSLRRATPRSDPAPWAQKVFLSTLSLRRATLHTVYKLRLCIISIHALLAESDDSAFLCVVIGIIFLSTLSLRRATGGGHISKARSKHFYPRSPCGERHNPRSRKQPHPNFYPRSPCGERP